MAFFSSFPFVYLRALWHAVRVFADISQKRGDTISNDSKKVWSSLHLRKQFMTLMVHKIHWNFLGNQKKNILVRVRKIARKNHQYTYCTRAYVYLYVKLWLKRLPIIVLYRKAKREKAKNLVLQSLCCCQVANRNSENCYRSKNPANRKDTTGIFCDSQLDPEHNKQRKRINTFFIHSVEYFTSSERKKNCCKWFSKNLFICIFYLRITPEYLKEICI